MKELKDFGKKLPYNESEEYIDNLWAKSIEKALDSTSSAPKARVFMLRRHVLTAIASAAILILITTVSWKFIGKQFFCSSSPKIAVVAQSPLDEFLGSISDEEAEQINYYLAEVIEEYH